MGINDIDFYGCVTFEMHSHFFLIFLVIVNVVVIENNYEFSCKNALSSIIPSLLNLECHLQQWKGAKKLAKILAKDFKKRFESMLQPDSEIFNPVPAAACIFDPTLLCVMTSPSSVSLLNAGKFLLSQLYTESEIVLSDDSQLDYRPALKRFKFLDEKLRTSELSSSSNNVDNTLGQLNKYIMDVDNIVCDNALDFWKEKKGCYTKLFMLAEDLLTAPASQAYVERIFSVCGILTAGRRNRMKKSLEMRVFLKLNKHIIS